MHCWMVGIALVVACSKPERITTTGRSVLVEVLAYGSCDEHCAKAQRPGERLRSCDQQSSGWELNPRFENDPSPFREPEVFDMAKRLGPLVQGYAFCTFDPEGK